MPVIPTAVAPSAHAGVSSRNTTSAGATPSASEASRYACGSGFGTPDLGGVDERRQTGELRSGSEPIRSENHVGVVGQDPDGQASGAGVVHQRHGIAIEHRVRHHRTEGAKHPDDPVEAGPSGDLVPVAVADLVATRRFLPPAVWREFDLIGERHRSAGRRLVGAHGTPRRFEDDVTDVEEQGCRHRPSQSAAQNRATAATASEDSSRTRCPASGNVATEAVRQQGGPRRGEGRRQQAVLLAPHDETRRAHPAEPPRHHAIEWVVPQHQGGRPHLPVAVDGEVDVVGVLRQMRRRASRSGGRDARPVHQAGCGKGRRPPHRAPADRSGRRARVGATDGSARSRSAPPRARRARTRRG